MPSTLTDFTSYDEIRAVIGVSDEELEDVTLALPMYLLTLQMELEDISPELETLYSTYKAEPVVTAVEQKFLDLVTVFSAYAVANHLLISLPLFAPQRITDGRAEVSRVSDPYEGVREGVTSMLQTLKNRLNKLLELLGQAVVAQVPRSYLRISPLAVNPVTNV